MADSTPLRSASPIILVPQSAIAAGEVRQLADGRAGVMGVVGAASTDPYAAMETTGQRTITKTTGIAILDGGRVFWDHSANAAHYKKVNDRDFYIGRAVGDAASADATMTVNLNVDCEPQIDLLRHGFLSVPTGTQAVGAFGYPKDFGDSMSLELTATNEAQCIDMLSVDRVAINANPIAEFIVRPAVNGSTSAVDFNVGVANGTDTADADLIAESVFFHIDGASTAIKAESDDGTTDVPATDTTKTISAGSAVANRTELWIDMRDPTSIKMYVDGVRVLTGTTFLLTAATGPIGLLVHLEKSSSTATALFLIDRAELRTAEQ